MLNEVKPNLDLLMSIRLGLAEQYGIPLDVPFRDYKAWYRWTGMEVPTQTMRADFVNQLYSKDGKPCRFEDIFEFERLSKAWDFIDGELEEYEVNEPRFSEKGLLIEPERTNRYTIPQGHTITGDWDDTLHLFERDGQLDFEGYGYIRTLEIVPIEVKV